MPESFIAPFLTELAARVKSDGVKVGSYPSFQKGVTVSLMGQNVEFVKGIAEEVRSTQPYFFAVPGRLSASRPVEFDPLSGSHRSPRRYKARLWMLTRRNANESNQRRSDRPMSCTLACFLGARSTNRIAYRMSAMLTWLRSHSNTCSDFCLEASESVFRSKNSKVAQPLCSR